MRAMISRFVLLCCVMLCGLIESTFAADTRTLFEYAAISNFKKIVAIDTKSARLAIGDVASVARFCEIGESMNCVHSEHFSVALKKNMALRDTWVDQGVRYGVDKKIEHPVFGRPGPFFLITATGKDYVASFLYSKRFGLVAFTVGESRDSISSYLLLSQCGFAMDSGCRE